MMQKEKYQYFKNQNYLDLFLENFEDIMEYKPSKQFVN